MSSEPEEAAAAGMSERPEDEPCGVAIGMGGEEVLVVMGDEGGSTRAPTGGWLSAREGVESSERAWPSTSPVGRAGRGDAWAWAWEPPLAPLLMLLLLFSMTWLCERTRPGGAPALND